MRTHLQGLRDKGDIDAKTTYEDVKQQLLDIADFAKAEELKAGFLEEVGQCRTRAVVVLRKHSPTAHHALNSTTTCWQACGTVRTVPAILLFINYIAPANQPTNRPTFLPRARMYVLWNDIVRIRAYVQVVKDFADRVRIRVRRVRRDLDPYCAAAYPDDAAFSAVAFADFKAQLTKHAAEEEEQEGEEEAKKNEGGSKDDGGDAEGVEGAAAEAAAAAAAAEPANSEQEEEEKAGEGKKRKFTESSRSRSRSKEAKDSKKNKKKDKSDSAVRAELRRCVRPWFVFCLIAYSSSHSHQQETGCSHPWVSSK